MARDNRECIICKKKYYFCNSCNGADATKPTWYNIFDGERCHDVYETCVAYRDKEINAEQAYEKISKLDLSDIKNFAESTRLQIEEIIKVHNETSVAAKTVKEDVVDVIKEEKSETPKEFRKDTNKYYKKK